MDSFQDVIEHLQLSRDDRGLDVLDVEGEIARCEQRIAALKELQGRQDRKKRLIDAAIAVLREADERQGNCKDNQELMRQVNGVGSVNISHNIGHRKA